MSKVIHIAGNLENHGGSAFEYEATRLKTSDSNSDSKKEGLRLVLKGGKRPLEGVPVKQRTTQRAVIEFLCDHEKTGLEGEWESEDHYESKLRKRDDDENKGDDEGKDEDEGEDEGGDDKDEGGDDKDEGGEDGDDGDVESGVEHQLTKDDSALIWESYGMNEQRDAEVLRLTWHTKYACEKSDDDGGDGSDDDSDTRNSWGFFTWLVIM